ncbi:anti-Muellerian hormone type-2 receptor-like isoform X2 [Nelusetta ayraudi]
MRFDGLGFMCACNADLCNGNITWNTESDEPQLSLGLFNSGENTATIALISFGSVLVLCFMIATIKWKGLFKAKCKNQKVVSQLRFHQIEAADIDLQHIVGCGNFATVWRGTYHSSTVAVKVFPAGWKHIFTAEKEVYELPLMKHSGIIDFLGSGRKEDGESWLIVLQFAECGSLHSFLGENTIDWMSSLKLCQSLSQGLSYLHSDLRKHDAHKPPVAHKDLSSSNVLVRADGTCALCDFGSSAVVHSFSRSHKQSCAKNMSAHAEWGTLRYISPEILQGSVNLRNGTYLLQGDVYALALLLWEIWMRCSDLFQGNVTPQHLLPYESELGATVTMDRLIVHVCDMEKRPSIPRDWEQLAQGSALQEILIDCWDYDPEARLTARCVANRLVSLQSCTNVSMRHLHCSQCVTTV